VDVVKLRRFDVWMISLDPTVGAEIRKTRPCVVISPDETNRHLRTVIIAPLTTTVRDYPSRVRSRFNNRDCDVALDELRAVDKSRLVKRLGAVSADTAGRIVDTLADIFG
jgi:mRNA interferase MazF